MKILVFTSLFPNHLNKDFGIFIKNRMINVSRLDKCEVVVIAPVPYCPQWKILRRWYQFSRIKFHEKIEGIDVYHPRYLLIPKISMVIHGFSMFLFSKSLFKKLHEKYNFDLIDAHYIYPDAFAGAILGHLFHRPVVVSARGTDINDFPRFKTIRPFIRWTLSKAGHVISVCGALKDAMVNIGCKKNKVSVIPNGIDTHQFYMVGRDQARTELEIDEKSKIILSVGGLIDRKGHHLTIEAMEIILEKIPEARLYIAGKGEQEVSLRSQVIQKCLEDRVIFLGHVPNTELVKWYNAADVFCLASSREGWANVIMEAMACGTPVVATNVWGAPEIITQPEVGLLVERTVESISKGLINALNKEWDRCLIVNHVSRRTWSVVAEEVKQVFDKVVSDYVQK